MTIPTQTNTLSHTLSLAPQHIAASYCRGAHAAIVVFNPTLMSSLEFVENFLETIHHSSNPPVVVLVANTLCEGSIESQKRCMERATEIARAHGVPLLNADSDCFQAAAECCMSRGTVKCRL